MVIQKYNLNETPTEDKKIVTKIDYKVLIYIWLVVAVLAVLSVFTGFLNKWFDINRFVFTKPVEVKFNKPITIEKRKPLEVISPIVAIAEEPVEFKDLDEVESVILDVFGIADFKMARAIAIHENAYIGRGNKWDPEALNINSKSIDIGIFQINSVHFSKQGCSFKELLEIESNVKCAKQIYDVQGWEPWVVFQTGSFKRSL